MKFLCAVLPLMLAACGSTQFSLSSDKTTAKPDECCPSDCDIDASCLPNGNCLITCTNAAGVTCEVELACSNGQCTVVRSECPPGSCCPGAAAKQ